MKNSFLIICLFAIISAFKPVYAENTCEYELFRLLDNNYNAAVDLSEFKEMFQFSQGKNSCEETLEALKKDRKPKHTMGKVNTAPSANFAPPANVAPATNYPPPSNFAPSKYFSDEEIKEAQEKLKEESEKKAQTPFIELDNYEN